MKKIIRAIAIAILVCALAHAMKLGKRLDFEMAYFEDGSARITFCTPFTLCDDN